MTILDPELTWERGNEPRPMPRCTGLAIHHTVVIASIHAIHRSHLGPAARARNLDGRGFAYSWFIDLKGDVWKGRGELIGSHTGGHNSSREGIAFEGNYSINKLPFHMLQAAVELCAWRARIHGFSTERIDPHNKFSGTACPGTKFPMIQLRELTRDRLLAGNPVRPVPIIPRPLDPMPGSVDLSKPPKLNDD